MKRMNLRKTLIAAALIGATALGTTALVNAQPGGYGPGYGMGPGMMGPGMMGGYGPGPGGGYGPGYGMGPGMMGPGMMGPGMMGGYGQGYGMGPGMMGGMMGGHGQGYGMGPGMMGGMMGGGMDYGMLHQLNLTPEQWKKANAIQEEFAKKSWEIAGKLQDEGFKLRNLMTAEKRDSSAIVSQFMKLQEIRTQRFKARLESQEKIDGVLTKEQKGQLRRFAPWWGHDVE
jgi:Spy/CpxP family protein refolding chaperone